MERSFDCMPREVQEETGFARSARADHKRARKRRVIREFNRIVFRTDRPESETLARWRQLSRDPAVRFGRPVDRDTRPGILQRAPVRLTPVRREEEVEQVHCSSSVSRSAPNSVSSSATGVFPVTRRLRNMGVARRCAVAPRTRRVSMKRYAISEANAARANAARGCARASTTTRAMPNTAATMTTAHRQSRHLSGGETMNPKKYKKTAMTSRDSRRAFNACIRSERIYRQLVPRRMDRNENAARRRRRSTSKLRALIGREDRSRTRHRLPFSPGDGLSELPAYPFAPFGIRGDVGIRRDNRRRVDSRLPICRANADYVHAHAIRPDFTDREVAAARHRHRRMLDNRTREVGRIRPPPTAVLEHQGHRLAAIRRYLERIGFRLDARDEIRDVRVHVLPEPRTIRRLHCEMLRPATRANDGCRARASGHLRQFSEESSSHALVLDIVLLQHGADAEELVIRHAHQEVDEDRPPTGRRRLQGAGDGIGVVDAHDERELVVLSRG